MAKGKMTVAVKIPTKKTIDARVSKPKAIKKKPTKEKFTWGSGDKNWEDPSPQPPPLGQRRSLRNRHVKPLPQVSDVTSCEVENCSSLCGSGYNCSTHMPQPGYLEEHLNPAYPEEMEIVPPWIDSAPNDIVSEEYQAAVALLALKYSVSNAPPLHLSPYPESALRSSLELCDNPRDNHDPTIHSNLQQIADGKVVSEIRQDQICWKAFAEKLEFDARIQDHSELRKDHHLACDEDKNNLNVSYCPGELSMNKIPHLKATAKGETCVPEKQPEPIARISQFTPINSPASLASQPSEKCSTTGSWKTASVATTPTQLHSPSAAMTQKYHRLEDIFLILARRFQKSYRWIQDQRWATLEDHEIFDRPRNRTESSLRVHFEDLKKKKRTDIDMEQDKDVQTVLKYFQRKWPEVSRGVRSKDNLKDIKQPTLSRMSNYH